MKDKIYIIFILIIKFIIIVKYEYLYIQLKFQINFYYS